MAQLTTQTYKGLNESYVVNSRQAAGGSERSLASAQHQLPGLSTTALWLKTTVVSLAFVALVAAAPRAVTIPLGVVFHVGLIVIGLGVVLEGWTARGQGSAR